MGNRMYRLHRKQFWAEGIFERFEHSRLQIEVSQIIIHKADEPDVVVNLLDADGLTGKALAEVDFFVPQTDATAARDHDGFVVEGIVDVGQSGVGFTTPLNVRMQPRNPVVATVIADCANP